MHPHRQKGLEGARPSLPLILSRSPATSHRLVRRSFPHILGPFDPRRSPVGGESVVVVGAVDLWKSSARLRRTLGSSPSGSYERIPCAGHWQVRRAGLEVWRSLGKSAEVGAWEALWSWATAAQDI